MGSLGLCGRGSISRLYSNKLHAELYTAATGMEISGEELSEAIERGINLEKAANVREGFTRKDDRFPERWFQEPLAKDYYNKVDMETQYTGRDHMAAVFGEGRTGGNHVADT